MSRLLDFSLALTLPTSQLVVAAVVLLFLTCLCAYFLYHRDKEARRLLDLAKNWRKQVDDEAKELQRTKVRIVATYSVTLVLCLFLTVRVCVELLRRF
jgi:multidrug efflux pump subunit AcrB